MSKYGVHRKGPETMIDSLAVDTLSAHIMISKYHFPLKAIRANWQNG